MHPEIARSLIAQHRRDLHELARGGGLGPTRRRAARRRLTIPEIPCWRITWSHMAAPAAPGGRAWLIVITARSVRSARSVHRIA